MNPMSTIGRHPLISFFVLSYALTWWAVPFGSFIATGPLLAALIVISITEGRAGLRELGARMIRWRVGWRWYAVALGLPLAVAVAAVALNVALGATVQSLAKLPPLSTFIVVFAVRLINPLDGPMGEEPGWRGYALPRLQGSGRSPLVVTVILGLLVVVWHLPLVIVVHQLPPAGLLGAFAVTFWFTWLFNHTGGSVLMTLLMHSAEGTFGPLALSGLFVGADLARALSIYVGVTCVVAIGLVVFDRRAWVAPAPTGATTRAAYGPESRVR
jgi:hypothetical protein